MKPVWLRYRKRMTFLYRFVIFIAWMFAKIFYRHKSNVQTPYPKGAAILACNHSSFLDPPLVAVSWPEEIHFLARQTLFNNPLFGWFIRKLNAHPVSGDASDIGIFRIIGRLLQEGDKILLFPEGRRSEDNVLGQIKEGTALLAIRNGVKVIPTYIAGAYEIWGRKRKFPKIFGKTRCVFGTAIDPNTFSHLDKKEAQKQLSLEIASKIKELRDWVHSGSQGPIP
jgi:1-acyl-sn-glycerol-3-phosphate acyltransferase